MRSAESKERYRRAIITTAASLLPRAMSLLATVLTIPLVLNSLGSERFGIWATVVSMSWLLSFADFGVGNGVVTAVARARGKNARIELNSHVSSALALLTLIALIMVLLMAILLPVVDWERIFHVKSSAADNDLLISIVIWGGCSALSIPASLIQKVQIGLQQGFYGYIWQTLGNLGSITAIYMAAKQGTGLPWFVFATVAPPLLAALLNSATYLARRHVAIRIGISYVNRKAMVDLFKIGGQFAILQLAAGALISSDSFIIATVVGAHAVADYAIPERLFAILGVLMTSMLMPLWPAYAEALAVRDSAWVREAFLGSIKLVVLIFVPVVLGVAVYSDDLVAAWTGKEASLPGLLVFGFAVWKILEGVGNACSTLLNGAGVMGPQVLIAIILIPVSICSKIVLVSTIGMPGIIWGTIVTYIIVSLTPSLYFIRRELARNQMKSA